MDQILQAVYATVAAHPKMVILSVIGWWFISAVISSLPAPEEVWPDEKGCGYFIYRTIYLVLHTFAGSVGRAFNSLRIQSKNGATK